MMLSMHGRPSEIDAFFYALALDLGKSVAEIMELENSEILNWRAFYTARHAIQSQK